MWDEKSNFHFRIMTQFTSETPYFSNNSSIGIHMSVLSAPVYENFQSATHKSRISYKISVIGSFIKLSSNINKSIQVCSNFIPQSEVNESCEISLFVVACILHEVFLKDIEIL